MTLEFRLLGGVEALVDGQPLDIGPVRQRTVLAILLAEANAPVSVDQLIDRVWADRPPRQVRNSLYSYVTRLRRALAPAEDVHITRHSGSYRLTVDEQSVDLHRFRRLTAEAHRIGDDRRAEELLAEALGLWRGDAFADLDAPWPHRIRTALDAERRAVELDRVDIGLRLGRHGELLAELAVNAERHPLDERIVGQLMLALYRSGRQSDAIDLYHRTRSQLVEQLGVDPGPALAARYQQLLTGEPAEQPRTVLAPRKPIPCQLPAAPLSFTGRADELAALTDALERASRSAETMTISSVSGTGGIGKTWLVLAWAYQHLAAFPDGQLFVDLRGFTPAGQPVAPSAAIRIFLDGLGVEPDRIPAAFDAQIGLYRSLVADKRLLIVLDNAADTAQVVPLLPGSATCTVVVTSRDRLTGLVSAHGATPLIMDALTELDARNALAARLGAGRLAAEPEAAAAAELLVGCAGFPLALSIVVGRAMAHPSFPLAELAGELRDVSTRLSALDEGEPVASLPAVLSWSYQALPAEQARIFSLLGLTPGPDTTVAAVAALAERSTGAAAAGLRALERTSLVRQDAPGRYRMHDLVRLYALEQAADLPPAEQEAALRRLTDFYLRTTHLGDRILDPHRPETQIVPTTSDAHPRPLADRAAALAWFDAEIHVVLAVQQLALDRGWYRAAWQLAWDTHTYLYRLGLVSDQVVAWEAGLAAARQLDEPGVRARALRRLGKVYSRVDRYDLAVEKLQQALVLAQQSDDLFNQANAHQTLGAIWEELGDYQRALEHAVQATDAYKLMASPEGEANALNQAGWYAAHLGHYEQARIQCEGALELQRHFGISEREAEALDSLGYIAQQSGRYADALTHYREAVDKYREIDDAYNEANLLDRLGHSYLAFGDHEQAELTWRQALALYETQHRDADIERIDQQLAGLHARGSDHAGAPRA
jgi:DNA-binding SARP family transcriptional activator/tetratricopeptide (TPR) repeat protein